MWSVIIGAAAALLAVWILSVRRRLSVIEENIRSAMAQIGVQHCSCLNILSMLLGVVKEYAAQESQDIEAMLKARRSSITAASLPDDIQKQLEFAAEILDCVTAIAEQLPELGSDERYLECVTAADSCGKMIHTGCLIYNDSVSAFNSVLRSFPTSLVGHAMGFRRRSFIATENS